MRLCQCFRAISVVEPDDNEEVTAKHNRIKAVVPSSPTLADVSLDEESSSLGTETSSPHRGRFQRQRREQHQHSSRDVGDDKSSRHVSTAASRSRSILTGAMPTTVLPAIEQKKDDTVFFDPVLEEFLENREEPPDPSLLWDYTSTEDSCMNDNADPSLLLDHTSTDSNFTHEKSAQASGQSTTDDEKEEIEAWNLNEKPGEQDSKLEDDHVANCIPSAEESEPKKDEEDAVATMETMVERRLDESPSSSVAAKVDVETRVPCELMAMDLAFQDQAVHDPLEHPKQTPTTCNESIKTDTHFQDIYALEKTKVWFEQRENPPDLVPDSDTGSDNDTESNADQDQDEPYVPDESLVKLEERVFDALDSFTTFDYSNRQPETQTFETSDLYSNSDNILDAFLEQLLDEEFEIIFERSGGNELSFAEDLEEQHVEDAVRFSPSQNAKLGTQQPLRKEAPVTKAPGGATISKYQENKAAFRRGGNHQKNDETEPKVVGTSIKRSSRNTATSAGYDIHQRLSPGTLRVTRVMSKLPSWRQRPGHKDENLDSMYNTVKSKVEASPSPGYVLRKKVPSGGRMKHCPKTRAAAAPKTRKHPDFYSLSPLTKASTALSSQCKIASFQSPRREGVQGCQQDFDPFLHDCKGPCELCIFLLSDQDKTKLDATGRHTRVMFTTGGCGKKCKVFPRSRDEVAVRLCRICYGNSHRKLADRLRFR